MVDNFAQIRSLLKFENDGDCYYVQLLRRQSDDPMKDGMPDPNYHGNMHSRSLKDYLIPSIEYLDRKEEEIKQLCNQFNVRAYIRLNKRTYNAISMAMLKHIVEQLTSGQSFNSPYSLVASAAGNANASGKDKTWIMDLDAEYVPMQEDIMKMMLHCQPYDKIYKEKTAGWIPLDGKIFPDHEEKMFKQFCEANIPVIRTKHGIHLICHPFNVMTLKNLWELYVSQKEITPPLPQWKIEHIKEADSEKMVPTVVFSLTDMYLKHQDDFFKICDKYGKAKKIPIDKNKTVIHYVEYLEGELGEVNRDWRQYCLANKIYMKCFDIHKDNPTILYVP